MNSKTPPRGTPSVGVSVRVWRLVAGAAEGLFTYAGDADADIFHAVMQHVRQLTTAVPGDWCIEVVGSGLDGALLRAVEDDLVEMRRSGIRSRLALAPRLRPELKALLAHAALTATVAEHPAG